MIRVERAPEPPDFDAKVRQPGLRSLHELAGVPGLPPRRGRSRAKPAETWTKALPDLVAAYNGTYAYFAMEIHEATGQPSVDHFRPKARYPEAAYDWDNFRLACLPANRIKWEHEDVLDPFEIEDGWFELVVMSGEVRPNPQLAPQIQAQVERTITRLKLNGSTLVARRRQVIDELLGESRNPKGERLPPLPAPYVRRTHPHVYCELERKGRLPAPGRDRAEAG